MTRRHRISLFVLGLLAIPGLVSAQVTPAAGAPGTDDTQVIRVGSTIFYDYTYTQSPKSANDGAGNPFNPSVFQVQRAYINVTGNINHLVSFRVTPDITSKPTDAGSTLNGSYIYRLKYGFAQFGLEDWTGNWKQTWVRFGVQQTPYVDWEENFYRYRFQGTVFFERDFTTYLATSSDAGVSFHTNIPNGYGEFHTGLYNGEKYSGAETNNEKSFQLRATVRPVPMGGALIKGLRITGFINQDHVVADGPRSQALGELGYEHRRFSAAVIAATGHVINLPLSSPTCVNTPTAACGLPIDAHGWSWWFTPFFKEKGNGWEMLLRMDDYKQVASPLLGVNNQLHRQRQIIGVSYWFPHPGGAATAALLFDFQRQHQVNEFAPIPLQATQQLIGVHGLINF